MPWLKVIAFPGPEREAVKGVPLIFTSKRRRDRLKETVEYVVLAVPEPISPMEVALQLLHKGVASGRETIQDAQSSEITRSRNPVPGLIERGDGDAQDGRLAAADAVSTPD
ncbi:hypothetical protein ACFU6I_07660 [Streptomyces sp. NPDC057486]|uniref:hypothetical protein n=1 Tax=Streptomyces sp. NPDC057486 TaxID=3346145 RepID=UPI003699F5A5